MHVSSISYSFPPCGVIVPARDFPRLLIKRCLNCVLVLRPLVMPYLEHLLIVKGNFVLVVQLYHMEEKSRKLRTQTGVVHMVHAACTHNIKPSGCLRQA